MSPDDASTAITVTALPAQMRQVDKQPTPAAPAAVAPLLLDAQPDADEPLVHRIGPDETLITLADAAKLLPRINGKKVGISAIWRWCRSGLRGIRLPYLRAGRRIVTSREALFGFFQALTDLDKRVEPGCYAKPQFTTRRPISSRRRQRALAEADAILERARI